MAKQVDIIEKIMMNMFRMKNGAQVGSVLLTGDPGIGKTTAIKAMSDLLGVPAIIIEVPHITEEHLINIPFLVHNPVTDSDTKMASKEAFDVVLAESNLFSQIVKAKKTTDSAYLKNMQSTKSPVVREMFEHLGGTETEIPKIIMSMRESFNCIVFLDEYYRQTTARIRHILRGILNRRLGIHTIPKSAYVVYASNMRDSGLDDFQEKDQFQSVEYKPPTKEEFFNYMVTKYKNDKKINLNIEFMTELFKHLSDDDMSFNDTNHEVRTSPRRWEQLLLYVNASLPIESSDDEKSLLSNVKSNFINYDTGEHSSLLTKFIAALTEAISVVYNQKIGSSSHRESDWRMTLDHQIKLKIKLGASRHHIPVISGPPGIGKTKYAWQVAENNGLALIYVDVSELNSDDVAGLPIPAAAGNKRESGMPIKFSKPKLYTQITQQMADADSKFVADIKAEHSKADADKIIKARNSAKFKYLIFFDELTAASPAVFNSLRRVILEKNFGPAGDDSDGALELPESSIVVGAMNPHGQNIEQLTGHFRDVIDVIPARSSWKSTIQYMKSGPLDSSLVSVITGKAISSDVKDSAIEIISLLVDKFKNREQSSKDHSDPEFVLMLGNGNVYVSPREYSDMYAQLVTDIDYTMDKINKDDELTFEVVKQTLSSTIYEAIIQNLRHPIDKAHLEQDEIALNIKEWVDVLPPSAFDNLISKKSSYSGSLLDVLEGWFDHVSVEDVMKNFEVVNVNDKISDQDVIETIDQIIRKKYSGDIDKLLDVAAKKTEDSLKYDANSGKIEDDSSKKISKAERAMSILLYVLHMHEFNNQRLFAVWNAYVSAIHAQLDEIMEKVDESPDPDALLDKQSELSSAVWSSADTMKRFIDPAINGDKNK